MALLEGLRKTLKRLPKIYHHARGASPDEGPEILRIQDRYFIWEGSPLWGSIYKKELGLIMFTLMN
jgi:hypothetical protein